MRELIYLSDGKLRQFLPEPIPRWRRVGRFKATVNVPIGSISLDSGSSDKSMIERDHFEKVINHVALRAKWFETEELRTGEWIFFEEWLNYRTLLPRGKPAAVVFINLFPNSVEPRRLLLHGSAKHLLGSAPFSEEQKFRAPSYSGGSDFYDLLRILPDLIRPLDVGTNAGHLEHPYSSEFQTGAPALSQIFEEQINNLVFTLDHDGSLSADTAAWMAGYARVTGKFSTFLPETVVASPLYVELCTPPNDDDPTLRPAPRMWTTPDRLPADHPLQRMAEHFKSLTGGANGPTGDLQRRNR